ncbi:period circadian protein-like [Salvia splendens]|uniref:period circadian protein-like n=1 Tax=Salvia splendens TaxID=180675 RepID=UPI001C25AEA2|nr:period circadian protein-like [Salvia splendens]
MSSDITMIPTPGFSTSTSTTHWVFDNPFGTVTGFTSSGSVGSTFSGSIGSFIGSRVGAFGHGTGVGSFGVNMSASSFEGNTSAGPSGVGTGASSFGGSTGAGPSGVGRGAGSFGVGTNAGASMLHATMGGTVSHSIVSSCGGNGLGPFHGTNSAPMAPRMMPPAEKPSKFM